MKTTKKRWLPLIHDIEELFIIRNMQTKKHPGRTSLFNDSLNYAIRKIPGKSHGQLNGGYSKRNRRYMDVFHSAVFILKRASQ